MQITQLDQVEDYSASLHRTGKSVRQDFLESESGLEGYSLIISRSEARFSPRHRHNFEQYRYQLSGTAEYSATGTLKPGMLGYFPEGMHYGPQLPAEEGLDCAVLVLQCGGASGCGYVNRGEVLAGAKELQTMGEFKDGVFYRNEGLPGKKNVEGSQAIWEHIMKRDLEYPKPRYAAPILTHPDNFDWIAVEDEKGVFKKQVGSFSERQTGAGFIKLEPKAHYTVTGNRDIFFVVSGTGSLAGAGGSNPYSHATSIFIDRGEALSITATETTEILNFRLPDLTGIQA
ncbi:MAG: hypothetical protein ACKVHL_02930 [Rhodospirillales bacterium]|jgi:hypothetical protein